MHRQIIFRPALFTIFVALAAVTASAQNIPKGFVVPKCSLSPDGRYGVTVPISSEEEESKDARNSVIELKTGRIVAVIEAKGTGRTRMGHGGVLPCRWSPDGSILVWEVSGKWFPDALVILKFRDGALVWQTDVVKAAQEECLKLTKRAAPAQFAKAKKANAGNGAAYPEGFSIYVEAFDPVSLPLRVRATLTSDPKEIGRHSRLESSLEGRVDENGKFTVNGFRVGSGLWQKFVDSIEARDECDFDEGRQE